MQIDIGIGAPQNSSPFGIRYHLLRASVRERDEFIMEKPWLKYYDPGVSAEIDPDSYQSVSAMYAESVLRFADRPVAVCAGTELTYLELERLSASFACWLKSEGLKKGTRIALMLPNILQFPIAFLGILRAGMISVGCNPLYTSRELGHQLEDSGAEVIVVLDTLAASHGEVLSRFPIQRVVMTTPADQAFLPALLGKRDKVSGNTPHDSAEIGSVRLIDVLADRLNDSSSAVDIEGGDVACLQYTGGTTGLSKGVMLTHRNLVANAVQIVALRQPLLETIGSNTFIAVAASPMYHAMGLLGFVSNACSGWTSLLIPNPRDVPGFVRTLQKYSFGVVGGSNSLLAAFLGNEEFNGLDFSSLKVAPSGAMPVRSDVAKKWHRVTGVPVLEGYGLSEATMIATCNPFSTPEFNGTVGIPIPSTIVTIRDSDGAEVPVGEIGEVCIQGPQVMKGYWQHPEETARVMTHDRALRTGDLGKMDDRGYLTLVDRLKDMILVSGFNVYPNEIEAIVAEYPGVKECAVIGVKDDKSGEVPKAFVVREDPTLTADAIWDHCRKNLTGYKVPKFIAFIEELPKNNVGKVLKRALRDS